MSLAEDGVSAAVFLCYWTLALLLILIPGTLLVRGLAGRKAGILDPLAGLGLRGAVGLSFWPLLFLLTSVLGWRWTPAGVRIFLGLLAATWIGLTIQRHRRAGGFGGSWPRHGTAMPVALAVVFSLIAATRWLHVRALVLPPWVDSVHHTMIVRLLLEQGKLPGTYAPFIPDAPFDYHWGWHAFVAFTGWAGGISDPIDVARLVMALGQLLNALVPVAVYLAGVALFRSRLAAAYAALLAGLVSWFPAYYAAWGRYTQLGGLFLLPSALFLLFRAARRPTFGLILLSAITASGLFLVHIREFFFFLLFTPFLLLLGSRHQFFRRLGALVAAGLIAALLCAPWIVHLLRSNSAQQLVRPQTRDERESWREYNSVPATLLWAPHNPELFALASGGLTGIAAIGGRSVPFRVASGGWMLLIVILSEWNRRRRLPVPSPPWAPVGLLALWCVTVGCSLNLEALGLPPLRLAPNSSAVISLFLPVSLAGGGWIAWLLRQVTPVRRVRIAAALLLVFVAFCSAWLMRDVVTPNTVLADAGDLKALRWVRENTPRNGRFAIRSQLWIRGTWIGLDGGYWLSVLTDRASVLPPALYPLIRDRETIAKIDEFHQLWSWAKSLDPPVDAALADEGVTHLFIGQRPGPLDAAAVRKSPITRLIYEDGPVAVFEIIQLPPKLR